MTIVDLDVMNVQMLYSETQQQTNPTPTPTPTTLTYTVDFFGFAELVAFDRRPSHCR